MSKLMTNEYARLLAEVKERIRAAQYAAFRAVNRQLVALYWDIGRMISKRQITGMHGDAVVEQLATDLRMEFPGISGFSRRNVFYMREFYIAYCNLPKVQPLVAQIGWTQNLIVLQRCRDPLECEFYIRMTKKFGWTKSVLIHQIENQSYEKTLLGQTNSDKAPGMQGFSSRNLKYMRAFSEAYPEEQFVQQVAAQIPWFHNCLLLDKVEDLRIEQYPPERL
jgi:predicted nuclease of restriction endonuclease-like (RecB) superfamily